MKKLLFVLLGVLPLVAACGGDDDATTSGTITVLAAASLTESFTELGVAFEKANPGTKVTFSFAASSALAEQANSGAPGDVIVTADQASFDKVTDVGAPTIIARNRVAILVEKANPKDIHGLADLARDDVVFVLCAPDVPCGKLGAKALEKAGVSATPASLEENVKGVVSKVTLGEADAGIVYATDVQAAAATAEGVDIDIAGDPDLEAVYPMGLLGQSDDAELAQAWIDFVAAAAGQHVLRAHGFLNP